jgi:hypothetical protein
MNPLVVRLSGMRQGVALAVAVTLLVEVVQMLFDYPEQRAVRMLVMALLSAGSLVWAVEEHLRGNKLFVGVFALLGLSLAATAMYIFPRVVA